MVPELLPVGMWWYVVVFGCCCARISPMSLTHFSCLKKTNECLMKPHANDCISKKLTLTLLLVSTYIFILCYQSC